MISFSDLTRASALAFLLAATIPASGDEYRGGDFGRGRGHPPSVVVDIDALGLIEAWWARQPEAAPPSTTSITHGGVHLLFRCEGEAALYVTIETVSAEAGGDPAVSGFGCGRGEGLFALRDGGLACRRGAWPAQNPEGGAAVIEIAGGGRRDLLIGECIGPTGIVVPAKIGDGLEAYGRYGAPGGGRQPAGCNRSSVTFRGEVTAGGC